MIVFALALLAADPQPNAAPASAVVTTPTTPTTPAVAAPKKQRSIYVNNLTSSSGVDAGTLTTLTSSLASSVQAHAHGLNVLARETITQMLDVEAQKQLLGCDGASASCIAEIVSAAGADLVLYGDVGKLGDTFIINLALFDATKQQETRSRVTLPKIDEALLAQIDIAVAGLLAPITGEKTGTSNVSTNGVVVPTISADELRGSAGLKAVNIKAEQALDAAQDAQDDKSATPEKRRDAWCALKAVSGANPYLEAATKMCDQWSSFVVANAELEKSMSADYQTLAQFLELKRKTKDQKLAEVDNFLQTYSRLGDRPMVKSVQKARDRLVATGNASMGDKDNDGIPDDVDKCPNEPEDKDGFQDDDGCPDPDNDGDGVPDKDDACPNEAGVPEKKGCPRTAGDVVSGAGDFVGNLVQITATQTFITLGAGLNVDTTFAPLGAHLAPGADITFAWTAFTGGFRFDYDTGASPADALILGGNLGLRVLQIPRGSFGLIDPSVGVDVLGSLGTHQLIAGPYVANTFKLSLVDVRVYYRYALYNSDASSSGLPPHEVGAAVTLTDSVDGLESLVKDSGTFLMTDTDDKNLFFGIDGDLDGGLAPLGADLDLGFGMRIAFAFFEGGMRLLFNTADTSGGHKGFFMGGYGGLQFFEIPKGDFAFLRPSIGVDITGNLDDQGGILAGPYIANTFKLTNVAQIRLYYRYGLISKGTNLPPAHEAGAELSLNMIELFK